MCLDWNSSRIIILCCVHGNLCGCSAVAYVIVCRKLLSSVKRGGTWSTRSTGFVLPVFLNFPFSVLLLQSVIYHKQSDLKVWLILYFIQRLPFSPLQLNPTVNTFQRKYVNEVKKCEEMERILGKCVFPPAKAVSSLFNELWLNCCDLLHIPTETPPS